MSTLAFDSAIFPKDLLAPLAADQRATRLDTRRAWWIVHTRPRQEMGLASELLRHGIPFYLPLLLRQREWHGGSYLPAFPQYLFLFGDDRERLTSLATRCVSRLLPVWDQDRLRGDLSQIRRLVATEPRVATVRRYSERQRVRVRTGRFRGFEGFLAQRNGHQRFVVPVSCLRQGLTIRVDEETSVECI